MPDRRALLLAALCVACTSAPADRQAASNVERLDLSAPPVALTWRGSGCDAQPAETPCAIDGAESLVVTVRGTWRVAGDGLWWQTSVDATRRVTRRGPGPGELIAPIAVGSTDDTVFMAHDIARAQLVVLSPSGARSERPVLPPFRVRNAVVRRGRLVAYLAPPGSTYDEPIESAIVAFDAERNAWSDTLAHFPDVATSLVGSEDMHRPRLPWQASVRWDVCPDGSVLLASSDRWAIVRMRGRDTVQQVVRAGAVTERLDARTLEAMIRDWELGALRRAPAGFRAAMLERARREVVEHRPLLEAVRCGDRGALVLSEAMRPDDTLQTWVRVSTDGRTHSRWSLPPVLFPQVVGDALVGVEVSGDGERLVVARPPLR